MRRCKCDGCPHMLMPSQSTNPVWPHGARADSLQGFEAPRQRAQQSGAWGFVGPIHCTGAKFGKGDQGLHPTSPEMARFSTQGSLRRCSHNGLLRLPCTLWRMMAPVSRDLKHIYPGKRVLIMSVSNSPSLSQVEFGVSQIRLGRFTKIVQFQV